jgi:hypothetical protein
VRRSLVEYVRELVRGYWSVVVALVLEALGLLAIFWTDTRALHVIGVVGVALGLLIAPFLAFHRMRLQRDAALQGSSLFPRGLRVANELSLGNWGLDSIASTTDDGIAARAMVGARHPVAATTQLDSALAEAVEAGLYQSSLEQFLLRLSDDAGAWELISPTNDWAITASRKAVPIDGEWEVWARCIVQLPRSFSGRWPVALADVFIRPRRDAPVPDAQFNAAISPCPQGRARLDLFAVRDLLSSLGTTVAEELAPIVFPRIIEQRWRERALSRCRRHHGLRLIGPNYDFRSRPHTLVDALEMPNLGRRAGAPNDNRLYAETPSKINSFARASRDAVIRDGILRCLRQHEYAKVEEFAHELATRDDAEPLALEQQHASGPSPA